MIYDVIVVGGGLAGLSAAVDLCSRGYKILLLEQRPRLGGRTYSFVDKVSGDFVDNGQHLMMGCYEETRRYLKMIGTDHLATLQPNLHIDFLHPEKGFASLECPPLPASLHLVAGLLGLTTLSFPDRLRLLRVGIELQRTTRAKEDELERITVDEWLARLGQSTNNRKYLWDIIAIGTLNDNPATVSALLFFRVLRAAFLGKKINSSLLIPRVGLSELLVEPARRFIESRGGKVMTGINVEGIEAGEFQLMRIRSVKKRTYGATACICAVPYYALSSLLPPLIYQSDFSVLSQFTHSPILTIHLWLDRTIIEREFTAVLDSNIQWVFNKSQIFGTGTKKSSGQYLSLVISGAASYVEMKKEQVVKMAMEDLKRLFAEASAAKVVQSLVIKEKRATFSPRPGIEALRPGAKTRFQNLFLAGDWTDTGFPATIEGAVISGGRAAQAADAFLRAKR